MPVLLVMSLVSKPYILDLTPGQSLIEFLLQQGFDVYMIDWGVPRPEDKRLRLEDYVLDFIPDCVERVLADSRRARPLDRRLLHGRQLSVMYAALHPDGPLKNLACFTTPVNLDGMELMRKWSDERYFDVDRIVDTLGNVPPELIYASFDMLRPVSQAAGQVRLWDNMWNDEFVKSYRMFDRWAADQIPFPGECFRQTTKELMWENKLYKNELELGGRRVDLGEHQGAVPARHGRARPHRPLRGGEESSSPWSAARTRRSSYSRAATSAWWPAGNAIYRLWPQLDAWLSERSI